MVFTVFQYIPLIEEENSVHSELCKKGKESKESESGNEGGEEKDSDEDCSDFLIVSEPLFHLNNLFSVKIQQSEQLKLSTYYSEITTPPPQA